MIMDKKILIIDIETTGFILNGGKIVEVGIVELNLNTGEIKTIFDNVCWENGITRQEVENSWIVQNSDLSVEEIKQSVNFNIYKGTIQNIIDSYPEGVTAYNNQFDFGFLENRGFTFPKKLPCPMLLSTTVCKIPSRNGYPGYKWPSVEEAYKFYFPNSNYIELHRGADDARHEAEIVFEMYKRGIYKID